MMPGDRVDYERGMALRAQAALQAEIDRAWPELSSVEREALFLAVVDRLACLHGFAVRRAFRIDEDEDD
jgi:alkylhydroperoxidase family enzyme